MFDIIFAPLGAVSLLEILGLGSSIAANPQWWVVHPEWWIIVTFPIEMDFHIIYKNQTHCQNIVYFMSASWLESRTSFLETNFIHRDL